MVLPWVKLGVLSLNASASATVGGLCTYCIFGGENKEEKEKIDEIHLQIKQAEVEFKEKKIKVEAEEAVKLAKVVAIVEGLKKTGSCLKAAEESYKQRMESLGIWKVFQIVRYSGESCK